MPNVSLRDDAIRIARTYTDFLAIYQNFVDEYGNSLDALEVLRDLDENYFYLAERTIQRVFSLNLMRVLTSSMEGLVDFLEEALIEDLSLFDDQDDPSLNDRFNAALLETLQLMNHSLIRDDLIQMVRITRTLFRPVPPQTSSSIATPPYPSLFTGIQGIVDNIQSADNLSALATASDTFTDIIGTDPATSPLNALFTELFNLSLFRVILSQENYQTHDIVKVPLIHFVGLTDGDLDFPFIWDSAALELTRVLITANNAITQISEIVNNIGDFLDTLDSIASDQQSLEALADLLTLVTQHIGISENVRDIVSDFLKYNAGIDMADLQTNNTPIYDAINDILTNMSTINWLDKLELIRDNL